MNFMRNLLYASWVLFFVKLNRPVKELIKCILVITIFGALFFVPGVSLAAGVTLGWDPNTDADFAGYQIYYGEASGEYWFQQDVGNQTRHTVNDLEEGKTYYFAVTAYNLENLESDYSKELAYTVPAESPTDPDCCGQEPPPPATPDTAPVDNEHAMVEILKPVQTSSSASVLDIGFQLDLENVVNIYKAELKFRVMSTLPFISIFHENKWIKARSSVKANEWIQIDVTDIALKSTGMVEFKLQCSGLNRNLSVDEVISNLELVIYSNGNGIPVANFVANPVTGEAPLSVDFDATAAFDSDGQLVGYEWDFGDNSYSDAGAWANHLYIDEGIYTAKLTVTDDEGNSDIQEIRITVSEKTDDQNYDNSTIVYYPSEIKNDAVSFEIGEINGSIIGAVLRFRVLEHYKTVVVDNVADNREVASKYSVMPNMWHEFDLTHIVDVAGAYAFKVLAQSIYDVRFLPLMEYEAVELVLAVDDQ